MDIMRFINSIQLYIILINFFAQNVISVLASKTFLMPDEGERHAATWMAYGATVESWGTLNFYGASRLIARKDLIRIAANIARFELVNMLISENDINEAEIFLIEIKKEDRNIKTNDKLLPHIEKAGKINFIKQPVNDLWMRDTGPVFVFDNEKTIYGVNFNFNGWGQNDTGTIGWKKSLLKMNNGIIDQRIAEDQEVADFIIMNTEVKKIETWLVMEGGGVEVNGKGTAVCTESCILNENRNPGRNKTEIEEELFRLLGIKKVIWLPGLKGFDVTDGHVDFYVRFVSDSKILCSLEKNINSPDYNITHENFEILSNATDAEGNKITVIPLVRPNFTKVEVAVTLRNKWNIKNSFFNKLHFAAGYVGFYLGNNFALMSQFGDVDADKAAFDTVSKLYPERKVLQITTDGIANGGGTIHCATQQQITIPKNDAPSQKNSAHISSIIVLALTIFIFILNKFE